jgi:hypothetical protein
MTARTISVTSADFLETFLLIRKGEYPEILFGEDWNYSPVFKMFKLNKGLLECTVWIKISKINFMLYFLRYQILG